MIDYAQKQIINTPKWATDQLWRIAKSLPAFDIDANYGDIPVDRISGLNLTTFTRAQPGTYIDSTGTLQTATANVLRRQWDATNRRWGWLVEEARTNLAINSADASLWQAINSATVSANAVSAPDGTTTADGVTAAATNSNVTQQVTIASSTGSYSVSCYIKNNNSGTTRIDGYIRAGSTINVSGGAIITWATPSIAATGSATNVALQPIGNGWFRVSYTITDNNAASDNLRIQFFPDVTTGKQQVYLWGLQYEAGAFPTSYIPTGAATATRDADVWTVTGSNFSRWYNQSEGTVFVAGSAQRTDNAAGGFLVINDSTSNNRLDIRQYRVDPIIAAGGSASVTWNVNTPPTITANVSYNQAVAYSANSHASSIDNALLRVSSSVLGALAANRVAFFMRDAQTLPSGSTGGLISRLTFWPRRLPDSVLQELTR